MPAGQTGLSMSDLPFSYSFINLVFIASTGIVEIEKLYSIALIAGLIGSFLLSYHPIQRLIDKYYIKRVNAFNTINPHKELRHYGTYTINTRYLRLSLNTESIKYEKNKIVSGIYFNIILMTTIVSMFVPNFQKIIGFTWSESLWYIVLISLIIMTYIIYRLNKKNMFEFPSNLRQMGLYFDLVNHYGNSATHRPALDSIKQAIDLTDWLTVRELSNLLLLNTRANWEKS